MSKVKYTRHPLSACWNNVDINNYGEIKRTVSEQGKLLDPIVLFEGQVLDGWQRYEACLDTGVEPSFTTFEGDFAAAIALIRAKHSGREHTKSSKALALAKMEMLAGEQKKYGSLKAQAEQLQVGRSTMLRARKVVKDAAPEVQDAVQSGEISLEQGAKVANLEKSEQPKVLADLKAQKSEVGRDDSLLIQEKQYSEADYEADVQAEMVNAEKDHEFRMQELSLAAQSDDQLAAAISHGEELSREIIRKDAEIAALKNRLGGIVEENKVLIAELKKYKKAFAKKEAA